MAESIPTGTHALTFSFSTQTMRVIMRGDEPWFVAVDVCRVLEIVKPENAYARLDDDEKGTHTVGTLGGQQEMTIINESGLYSLILTSRKPEAKKFKKWVTSEVLPSIRKTGRYEAPQAAKPVPAHVAERLGANDMLNIQRVLHYATQPFNYQRSWSNGCWHYIRKSAQLPSPQPFTVDHLPVVASDLNYILSVASWGQELIFEIEKELVRRIFRKGETADLVLKDMTRRANERLASMKEERTKFPSWLRSDLEAIEMRKPAFVTHYNTAEQLDFFKADPVAA